MSTSLLSGYCWRKRPREKKLFRFLSSAMCYEMLYISATSSIALKSHETRNEQWQGRIGKKAFHIHRVFLSCFMKNTYSDGIYMLCYALSQLNRWEYVCVFLYYVCIHTIVQCIRKTCNTNDISSYAKRNKIAHRTSWHSTRVRIIYRITIPYFKNKCTLHSFVRSFPLRFSECFRFWNSVCINMGFARAKSNKVFFIPI